VRQWRQPRAHVESDCRLSTVRWVPTRRHGVASGTGPAGDFWRSTPAGAGEGAMSRSSGVTGRRSGTPTRTRSHGTRAGSSTRPAGSSSTAGTCLGRGWRPMFGPITRFRCTATASRRSTSSRPGGRSRERPSGWTCTRWCADEPAADAAPPPRSPLAGVRTRKDLASGEGHHRSGPSHMSETILGPQESHGRREKGGVLWDAPNNELDAPRSRWIVQPGSAYGTPLKLRGAERHPRQGHPA
jgi:hypothetical protein